MNTEPTAVELSPETLARLERLNAPSTIMRLRARLSIGDLGPVAEDVAEVLKQRDMLLAALKLAQRGLTTAFPFPTEALDVANDVIARCDP